jgi:gliding motility-associated-like protein
MITHTGLVANSNYCYYVRAKDGTGLKTSSSNRKCVFASLPVAPNFTYDQSSSVINPGEVKVDVFVDVNASTSGFRFERADNPTGPFGSVGYVPFSGSPSVFIVDATAKTESQSHYYQVITLDSCGNPSQTSNLVRTIYAQGTANSDMTNTITWNDYQGFDAGVDNYDLYRSVDGSPFALVTNINFGTNIYIDDVSAFLQGDGKFEYFLVANEGPGNIYSITASAASNIAEVFQPSKFFVPNAFVPGGNNPVFIPVGSFYDKSEYTFLIYNRWGQEIFSTDKSSEGWDGTYQGKVVHQDVFAWFIKYKASNGEYVELNGTVTVIGR